MWLTLVADVVSASQGTWHPLLDEVVAFFSFPDFYHFTLKGRDEARLLSERLNTSTDLQ